VVFNLLGGTTTLSVAVDTDLSAVQNLVTGTLSDGAVGVDLGDGAVEVDLDALFGAAYASSTGLNGQPPNTAVLTPEVLGELSTRAGSMRVSMVNTTIAPALLAAVESTSVRVDIVVPVLLLGSVTLTF